MLSENRLNRRTVIAGLGAAALALDTRGASAQTMGFATMQPGTNNHTAGSAIAKVLKEKAGLNVLVQPTAGESVIIPIVGRGEAELGMANAPEVGAALAGGGQPTLRLIGAVYPLRSAFWVRKDSTMRTVADLRGKRVALGFSAMRALDPVVRAMLATGGLSEKDVQPVLVPNVVRSADDFVSGAADMFYFAFGAPKVREADATVGGTRVLEIPDSPGMEAARKISPYGYLSSVCFTFSVSVGALRGGLTFTRVSSIGLVACGLRFPTVTTTLEISPGPGPLYA